MATGEPDAPDRRRLPSAEFILPKRHKCRRSASASGRIAVSPHRTKGYRVSREERKDYRSEGALMLLLAYGLVQAGVAAIVNPVGADSTSVARLLPDGLSVLELGWQVTYVIGGLLIFVGVLRPWPVGEVLGEWAAAWAMFVNILALLLVRGFSGAGASLGAFLIAIGICVLRIRRLHRRAQDRRNTEAVFPGPEKRRRR